MGSNRYEPVERADHQRTEPERYKHPAAGTGNSLQFPEDQIFALLYKNAIGVEFMDTPAACRTYNILMSEGRSVAAALMAIR